MRRRSRRRTLATLSASALIVAASGTASVMIARAGDTTADTAASATGMSMMECRCR